MKTQKWYAFWKDFWGWFAVAGWIIGILGAMGSCGVVWTGYEPKDETETAIVGIAFFIGFAGFILAGIGGNLENKYCEIAYGDERWRWCPNAKDCTEKEHCKWYSHIFWDNYETSCSNARDPNNPPRRKNTTLSGYQQLSQEYMKQILDYCPGAARRAELKEEK